jgi:hypothetical protein
MPLATTALPPYLEVRASHGWNVLDAENRRIDDLDFGTFDFGPGVRELLAPAAVVLAVTVALAVWLVRGG